MGSPNSDTISIAPGIHTFNFACQLPVTCPSSFEGNKGRVRYLVRVSFIRPWKFDQNTTLGFTVLKLADLNYDSPVLRMPAQAEIIKNFCCGPCRSKPLLLTVKVPKTGYVSGEVIPVTVDIDNPTKTPIKE
uniref:Uncharacterized protein n=1 Tax=Megaselia scalaris TaxID=36166 RepID=T1GD16_MEGSC